MFEFATEELNAIAGEDYTTASGTVTIPAGNTSATVDIEILGDTDFESDETFNLNLSNISGATFAGNRLEYSVLGKITNDDSATVMAEYGLIDNLTHELLSIDLSNNFTNPVVFVQPLSFNDSNPSTVRLQDIQGDSFSLFIQESSNQDGFHTTEQVSYLVLEAGTWQLPNGDILQTGTVESDQLISEKWQSIVFSETFDSTPGVFTQVQTNNDPDLVQTRQRNISNNGFEFGSEEEEISKNSTHGMEQLGWFAISSGSGDWSGNNYQVGYTEDTVTHNWSSIEFSPDFSAAPQLFASLATYDGGDPARIRYQNLNSNNVEIKIEEDTTLDSETNHTTEQISYFALEGAGLLEATAIETAPILEGADVTVTEGKTTEDYFTQSRTATIFTENSTATVETFSDRVLEKDETFDLYFPATSGTNFVDKQAEYSGLSEIENNNDLLISSVGDYAFSPVESDF